MEEMTHAEHVEAALSHIGASGAFDGEIDHYPNPMSGVRPRNWSHPQSGWCPDGAVEMLRGSYQESGKSGFHACVAEIAMSALEQFEADTGCQVVDRDVVGAVVGVVKQFAIGAKAEIAFIKTLDTTVLPPCQDDETNGVDVRTDDGRVFQVKCSTRNRYWDAPDGVELIFVKRDGDGRITSVA